MDKIPFIFEETGEEVVFAILSTVQYKEVAYLMVVDEDELDDDDVTAYILKATAIDGEDVIYDIVDDDDEIDAVAPLLEEALEDFDLER